MQAHRADAEEAEMIALMLRRAQHEGQPNTLTLSLSKGEAEAVL